MKNLKKIVPEEQDLRSLAAFYCTAFHAPERGEVWTEARAHDFLRDRVLDASIFAVLEGEGGVLAGFCCGGPYGRSFLTRELGLELPRYFILSAVVVDAPLRGRGLGRAMVEAFCGLAAAEDGYKGFLTICPAGNEPMLRVLHHAGFGELGRYEEEQGGVPVDRVVLPKGLVF